MVKLYRHLLPTLRDQRVVDYNPNRIMKLILDTIMKDIKARCSDIHIKRILETDDQRLYPDKFQIRTWYDENYAILYVYYKLNNVLESLFMPYVDIYKSLDNTLRNRIDKHYGYHSIFIHGTGVKTSDRGYAYGMSTKLHFGAAAAWECQYADEFIINTNFYFDFISACLVNGNNDGIGCQYVDGLKDIHNRYCEHTTETSVRDEYEEYKQLVKEIFSFDLPEFITADKQTIAEIEWSIDKDLKEVTEENELKFKISNDD